jgi:plastocyanin
VRWLNNASASHTATNDPGTTEIFHVVIAPGGQGTRKFDNAGAFPYHCEMASHQMSGTLVVIP